MDAMCLMGIATSVNALVERLKFTVASWMLAVPYFGGFSTDQILFYRREVAF